MRYSTKTIKRKWGIKMTEEEKKAICELKNYISRRKLKYTKLDRHDKSIYNLLNLIEKLQKENEELKQDRNNNYQMIALAQNEMLGYIQGYEDGQKLKRSATACVVENQQYYIIRKEIEHYKENQTPAIILIPGVTGNTGEGIASVKKSVEKAVGSDIIFND